MHYRKIKSNTPIRREDYPEDAMFFFDFDGVLCDQIEEQVFRMPVDKLEPTILGKLAPGYDIDPTIYEPAYLRHLVMQAQMAPVSPQQHEPLVSFARGLDDPFFIVTARTGHKAVFRMMNFLARQALHPQEIFCLGRVSKAAIFEKLREEWPDRPFVYFEDSETHIEKCMELKDDKLFINEVRWPKLPNRAKNMRFNIMGY